MQLFVPYYKPFSSYDDGVEDSLNSNYTLMFANYSLLLVYIAFTLGGWNVVEQRVSFSKLK